MNGLLDTSVLVALEQRRKVHSWPSEGGVSVMSFGELLLGVLLATRSAVRAQRLHTLSQVDEFELVPVDESIARHFAEIVADSRSAGRRPKIADSLIAATARALDVPLYTQDADFEQMPGVEVVRV